MVRIAQGLFYSNAMLMAQGYHAPKKLPSFEKAFPDRKAGKSAQSTVKAGRVISQIEAIGNMKLWSAAFAAREARLAKASKGDNLQ